MTQLNQEHSIYSKEYISEKDYNEINQLSHICFEEDNTNLKLELSYKLFVSNTSKRNFNNTDDRSKQNLDDNEEKQINKVHTNHSNEFLYYIDGTLVAYLGICCFGGNIVEINGMTHPDWRRKGIFRKLFDLAIKECQNKNFSKIHLLTDGESETGKEFIKSVGGIYDTSEYRMKLMKYPAFDETSIITLRIAKKRDKKKISEFNVIFFYDEEENETVNDNNTVTENKADNVETSEDEPLSDDPKTIIYLAEIEGYAIGKIHVEHSDNSAFICGFGILPNYRKRGYGKATLKEVLRIIAEKNITDVSLDVVCTNSNALNLYIGCGFEQQSIMDYYRWIEI
jgi:ribosomal protein S18 acetylase RimI-like enzyme